MRTARKRRLSRLAVNVLLSLLTVVAMLALVEATARMLVPTDLTELVRLANGHCWRRSALLGHENAPDCRGKDGPADVRINSVGLRGPELRPDGAVRILAVGDSCTYGYEVAESDAYPAVLQRLLDERGGSTRYEVLNAGVEGYTSLQGLIYLRERGLALGPAIVVFAFGFNDAIPDGDIGTWIARQGRFMPFLEFSDWLGTRSSFWAWFRSRKSGPNLLRRVTPERHEVNMQEIARLAREHGAKPIAVAFTRSPLSPYRIALQSAAAAADFPVLVYSGPRLPDDIVHPTPLGYGQLATALLERLVELGYVN